MSPRAEFVYSGLIKMHAHDISRCAAFRKTGQLTTNQVHDIARDLDALNRPHPLDATIEKILAQADAFTREREAVL